MALGTEGARPQTREPVGTGIQGTVENETEVENRGEERSRSEDFLHPAWVKHAVRQHWQLQPVDSQNSNQKAGLKWEVITEMQRRSLQAQCGGSHREQERVRPVRSWS